MVDNLREVGLKMQAVGCLLTIVFSIPLVLGALFGMPGLIVGVVISLVVLGSAIKSTIQKK